MKKLTNLLEWLVRAEDPRQQVKIDHLMKHNSHRVFRDAGERQRVDRDAPVCDGDRETPSQAPGIAQRHTVARHDMVFTPYLGRVPAMKTRQNLPCSKHGNNRGDIR